MGSTATTETQEGTAGSQSAEGRRMMQLLGQVMEQGASSAAVQGDFRISPSQQALINQAQGTAGDVARGGMEQNMEAILRQLEDSNIGRQITGGSLEAVNQALVGQEQLRNINTMETQQAGQAAQMALNVPFQAAEATNQALLARLVQPATTGLNYEGLIRQLNATQTGTTEKPWMETYGPAAFAGSADVGSAALTG